MFVELFSSPRRPNLGREQPLCRALVGRSSGVEVAEAGRFSAALVAAAGAGRFSAAEAGRFSAAEAVDVVVAEVSEAERLSGKDEEGRLVEMGAPGLTPTSAMLAGELFSGL